MDLYIKVNKYKKIILTILLYFIVGFIVLGNIVKVKAEPSFHDTNSPKLDGAVFQSLTSDYGYLDYYDGIIFSICAKGHGCKENIRSTYINVIYTFRYTEKADLYYVDRTFVPKLSYPEGLSIVGGGKDYSRVSFSIRGYISELSDLNYMNSTVGVRVNDYLENLGYANLKSILEHEASLKGSTFEKYFQKDDFVIVEPFVSMRVLDDKNSPYFYAGTANGLIYMFSRGPIKNKNVGSVEKCPKSPCPSTWFLKPIIVNMLTFRAKPGLDCSINDDIAYASSYSSTNREGCGYFKYNLDDILKPQNPTCTYDEKNNKYYDSTGAVVSKSKFEQDCPQQCKQVPGSNSLYYNSRGKIVYYDEYNKDCNTTSTGGTITIKKVDRKTGQLITTSSASFLIIDNADCQSKYWSHSSSDDYCSGGYCSESEVQDPNNSCSSTTQCKGHIVHPYYSTSADIDKITTKNGVATFDASPGKSYCIIEISAPTGYKSVSENKENMDACSSVSNSSPSNCPYTIYSPSNPNDYESKYTGVKAGDTVTVYNDNTCETVFNGLNKNSLDERIWAFRYFAYFIKNEKDRVKYYNFLNLNIKDATTACKVFTPTVDKNTLCLSGSYDEREFTKDNISNYNYLASTTDGKGIAYCQIAFNLKNNLGVTEWNVKSGEMPIQYANSTVAATGKLRQACYLYPLHTGLDQEYKPDEFTDDRGQSTKFDYSTIVTGVYLGEGKDGGKLNESTAQPNVISYDNKWSDYIDTVYYSLYPVYAESITGKISYDIPKNGNSYKFLGYGVVSKFDKKQQYSIPYSISFGSPFSTILGSSGSSITMKPSSNNECKVYPKQEIITTSDNNKTSDKLNLSFRIIDTSNPFPGKSGTVRKVGTNWKATSAVDDETAYNNWVSNSWKSSSLYINNNKGNATSKDYGFNSLVAYVMETTNNSLDKNKTGPIYTIKLTPTNIKEIRKYNKNNDYDDFTLKCQSDATNCTISETFVKVVGKENFVKNI